MLMAIKHIDGPVRPTDIARWLDRSVNSVSMIIDRMVKAGLVRRTRDRKDRRVVNVSLTSKGEKALGPAAPAGWEFIQKMLSPLSDKEKQDLNSMLEVVKCEIDGYLNPKEDKTKIIKDSYTKQPGLYERMVKNIFPSTPETKRRGGKKGKTI